MFSSRTSLYQVDGIGVEELLIAYDSEITTTYLVSTANPTRIMIGCADGSVHLFNVSTREDVIIGQHNTTVIGLTALNACTHENEHNREYSYELVSASTDGQVNVYTDYALKMSFTTPLVGIYGVDGNLFTASPNGIINVCK